MVVKMLWYQLTRVFGLWDQSAAWWRYVLFFLTPLVVLLAYLLLMRCVMPLSPTNIATT